jgi:hypothetical protein
MFAKNRWKPMTEFCVMIQIRYASIAVSCMLAVSILNHGHPLRAQAPTAQPTDELQKLDPPEGLTRLAPDGDIWIDAKGKRVLLDGHIAQRSGPLEMFACPRGTKEHESVVSVNCKAKYVHAALLAVGAKPGSPVRFDPEYRPASGSAIDVLVQWKDDRGKEQQVRAQEWIKNAKTQKPLEAEWVFAGSGFWKDPATGENYYHADGGDFICVSNFPSAMLDLPISSSESNDALLFEAFTDRIPPDGTPVRLILKPRSEPAP